MIINKSGYKPIELPVGYDERISMAYTGNGDLFIVHPDNPPLKLEKDSSQFIKIDLLRPLH